MTREEEIEYILDTIVKDFSQSHLGGFTAIPESYYEDLAEAIYDYTTDE